MFITSGCNKNSNGKIQDDYRLDKLSQSQIKQIIVGKWKINFATGGITNMGQKYSNAYIDFKFNTKDSIIYFENDSFIAKSPITWIRIPDMHQHVDSVFLLAFDLASKIPTGLIPLASHKDSLWLGENGIDGYIYWLTRK